MAMSSTPAAATPKITLAEYVIQSRGVKEKDTSEPGVPFNKEGAWAAFGFAIVLLVLGFPVWWRTTTVYRAPLPYTTIQNLASLRRLHFVPVTILTNDYVTGDKLSENLGRYLSKKPSKTDDETKYHVSRKPLTREQNIAVEQSKSLEELVDAVRGNTPLHSATLALLLLPPSVSSRLFLNSDDDTNKKKTLIHVTKDNLLVISSEAQPELIGDVLRRLTGVRLAGNEDMAHVVVTEPSYSLTITLMLPEPHLTLAHWDSRAAVQAYLSPFLKQLEGIQVKVKVRCQHLYMTPLSGVQPTWNAGLGHYVLPHSQLPLAINAIEAKLGSFVSTDPAFHFIVYVPGREETPLRIHDLHNRPLPSNSFVVPRWGGVIIQNAPSSLSKNSSASTAALSSSDKKTFIKFHLDAHAVMQNIMTQLHTLLPIPRTFGNVSSSLSYQQPTSRASGTTTVAAAVTTTNQNDAVSSLVTMEPPSSPRLTQWQLDALARARVTQYYSTTSTALQSLCELVGEISNMVVSEEVGSWVWQSVGEWEACGDATQEGRLLEASQYCTEAHSNAQAAFFHPSMLALLYFPDNQKYAIYVPLFLPVSIPVLLSFKMLYYLFKSNWTKDRKVKTN